ncbi:MAG: carboxypeptidase regulatory-like domain-containing protein, partial [Caldilineaceae bacterium]|nr:carboxypeptidase regulatory-like domain-containing protein [Caldilineaceae bacterium]
MSKRILPQWLSLFFLTAGLTVAILATRPVSAAGASISGTVTNGNAQPINGVTVNLTRNMQPEWGYESWQNIANTTTDENGLYGFTDLVAGTYRLRFIDESFPPTYATSYYAQQRYPQEATTVTVAENENVTGINAQLALRGSLGGRVTEQSGDPIDMISVKLDLQEFFEDGTDGWYTVATALTDNSGYYRADHLDPGNYRVLFDDDSGTLRYSSEIYDDAVLYESATTVVVTAGQLITGINAALDKTSTITGVVTNAGGQPLSNIAVAIHHYIDDPLESYWYQVNTVYTDETGGYRATGLVAGAYRVGFSDSNYPPVYAPIYFDGISNFD